MNIFRPLQFVVSLTLLTLSGLVESAVTEPASLLPKEVFTREQCLAQLAAINDSVTAYNRRVDESKMLRTQAEAMLAELDREEATLDSSDGAAVDAFNAKVRRNNELVERHRQIGAELALTAVEAKQRTEQFRNACDNKPAVSHAASSQATLPDATCDSSVGVKEVRRRVEATIAEMRADEKVRQAEVDRVARARAVAQSWDKEKQGKVWMQILVSPKFMAFESEKQPYVQELMQIMASGLNGSPVKGAQEQCALVRRVAAALPAIKAINARQYAFMASEIRVAK